MNSMWRQQKAFSDIIKNLITIVGRGVLFPVRVGVKLSYAKCSLSVVSFIFNNTDS